MNSPGCSPFTDKQRAVREKVWRAAQDGSELLLSGEKAALLWETIMLDAKALRDPEESILRAVRWLRGEGKTEEQIIDLVGKVMAETMPQRLYFPKTD